MTKLSWFVITYIGCFTPIVALSQELTNDTVGKHIDKYTNYFGVMGGYAYGDATLYRLGLAYSIVYGHSISSLVDVEGSIHITGRDGESDLGFVQVLSSTALDITCMFKPFHSTGFRIGTGISARRRQFFYSAPPIGTSLDDEDRFIRDTGLGANVKIRYTVFQSLRTDIGIQAEGQYFIPIQGEYSFQRIATSFQRLRFHP